MTTTSPSLRLVTGLALGALALGGCTGGGSASTSTSSSASTSTSSSAGSTSVSPTAPATSSVSASASATSATPLTPSAAVSSSASASPTASGPSRCTTTDLRVTASPGGGAAGSVYYALRLTNISAHPCRTGGFGGVSLVRTPAGAPVGAPADRVRQSAAKAFTLQPRARATATLRETRAENYPASTCRPVAAKGLRVYPPNQTRSAFVRLASTACSSRTVHLLALSPYRPGD